MVIVENKGRAHSTIDNQNEVWMDMKGAWLTYALSVTFLHLLLLSIPIFATATAWTLTNVIHDVVSFSITINCRINFSYFSD